MELSIVIIGFANMDRTQSLNYAIKTRPMASFLSTGDMHHILSLPRLSHFSACNTGKLGIGLGTRLVLNIGIWIREYVPSPIKSQLYSTKFNESKNFTHIGRKKLCKLCLTHLSVTKQDLSMCLNMSKIHVGMAILASINLQCLHTFCYVVLLLSPS